MEKILKLLSCLMVVFLLLLGSCRTEKTATTKNHIATNTTINHKVETIQLPTNYTFLSKAPCRNDSLTIANQLLEIGGLKLKVINLNGELAIRVATDTTRTIKEKETLKHTDKQVEIVEKTIIVSKIPKWVWYLLSGILIYVMYRVARIYFPFIRFLPY